MPKDASAVCDLDHEALPFRYCSTKGCTWVEAEAQPVPESPESVVAEALGQWVNPKFPPGWAPTASRIMLNGLVANGYVVVPRHEWEALAAALHKWSCGSEGHSLDCQRAAVVEAVGPTT